MKILDKLKSLSKRTIIIVLVIIALAAIGIYYATKSCPCPGPTPIPPADSTATQLRLVNSSEDSVLVFLTLSGYPASDTVHVKSVSGIFGIVGSGLVGSFYLGAGDSTSYTSSQWFSGNVGFGTQPMNCTVTAWPTGANPFEFNLNNNQESIDISAMGGVNCLLTVNLLGGPEWQASPAYPNVRYMYNDSMWKNSGLIGVYPYGCTNCTNADGKQTCQTPNEQPNTAPICTPTRGAGLHGGVLRVSFLGYTNTYICADGITEKQDNELEDKLLQHN